MITFEAVSRRYGDAAVVDNVSFYVPAHTIAVIVGTSGAGKSTLLRMVNRLVEPSAGVVRIDGEDVATLPPYALRRRIGYAIQNHGLFPHRTVAENIATVPKLAQLAAGAHCGARRRSCWICSSSAMGICRTVIRMRCPAGSGSAWGWRARWRQSRIFC